MPNNKKKKHKKKNQHDKNNSYNSNSSGENLDNSTSIEEENSGADNEKNQSINKPYTIKYSEIFGRYLATSKDIPRSEILISRSPLVIGPCANENDLPICLGCFKSLANSENVCKCSNCDFPMCSTKCSGINQIMGHSDFECKSLKDHQIHKFLDTKDIKDLQEVYECILILRCLLLKDARKDTWTEINEMQSHNETRKNLPALWNRNQKVIVDRIRNDWKYEEFTEDEIHTICGIMETNCFEVGTSGINRARALYPEAFYICHDCVPNTTHTDNPDNHELTIRTTKLLKKDEIITLSYSYTLQGTLKRREHLNDCKFFWCVCNRCKDPTELGTDASTLMCPKCKHGHVLSTDTLNQEADWKCQKCGYIIQAKVLLTLLNSLFDELDAIDGNDIDGYEDFLKRYSTVLHKNHYLFLSAKHSLCQLYGKTEGYLLHEMDSNLLKHKEDICRDLLEVIDVLEPGASRLRGVVLYELHAPLMVQINRDCAMGKVTRSDIKRRLKEVVKFLKESYDILQYEPDDSPEKVMALAASDALQKIGYAQNEK